MEFGIVGEEMVEVVGATMKGEDGVMEVGVEGKGSVEGFIGRIGGERREKGLAWKRRRII